MNKKGNFPDVAQWITTALVLGIVILLTTTIYNKVDDQFQSNDQVPEIMKNASSGMRTAIPNGGDIIFVFLLISFVAFSVMASRLIPSTPKFIIIVMMALVLLPFIAMVVQNIWEGFAENSAMTSAINSLTFLPFIMDHLTIVVLIYSTLVGIALLTKSGETL